jgi:dihydrofolate reductase
MISIIVAITADKGAIGRKGDLIYHISADLKRFKALTTGNTVIMGRRTFDSLPKGALPNRRNIVVTHNADFAAPGAERAASLEEAIAMSTGQEIFIIGGATIYEQALPLADRLCLTSIEEPTPADADTFFPPIDPEEWQLTDIEEHAPDKLRYRFLTLSRVK